MLSLNGQPVLHRRLLVLCWALLAALPVFYIATQVVGASRNIVFWDEFDTALDLVLRIHAGADWQELFQRFFAINNEHRTVTSRLMFAGSYWLTGTVNFHVIGAIGNLFMVGTCAALVFAVTGWERRIRMGVVLAFLMFQLEHFENFIWSGASIDHFQVVMLGVVAIVGLVRSGRGNETSEGHLGKHAAGLVTSTTTSGIFARRAFLLLALLCGFLATFTLAQGNVVWPIGALLLAYQRRWNQLAGWIACAVVAVAAFLHGFEFNPSHNISAISLATIGHIARYWLALLGAPLTLGDAAMAPLPGLMLLTGFGLLVARGATAREPVAMFSALFAMGALGLIAFGRSEIASATINSRYMVLGALAWAMLIYLLLELGADARKPFRLLMCLVPALAAFNVSANVKFAPMVDTFVEVRDRAATSFQQFGEDGRGVTRLHPRDRHAEILLRRAEESGVYRLPEFSKREEFPNATLNPGIVAYLDEFIATERAITIGGWGMIPGRTSKRGDRHVILRSEKSLIVLTAVAFQRSDVARAYNEPRWNWSGFRAVIHPRLLPAEDFEVGVLIADGDRAEFIMTPNRLLLSAAPPRAERITPKP